jgi:class 3 adenylate cyclase
MEEFFKKINNDIRNIFEYNIESTNTYKVPSRDDVGLTFSIGADKKGKLIETCVLMIDIRNSTYMSKILKSNKTKLGKIYSSFIYVMAEIADEYGYVRNIIGDRLMVVFEPKDCFKNAISCAAAMYGVANKFLKHYVNMSDFRVGIGIDFGEMLVLKTGIVKKHEEVSEYKNLVWIGDTANTASKLTDAANVKYDQCTYDITYEDIDVAYGSSGYGSYAKIPFFADIPKREPIWSTKTSFVSISPDEFVQCVDYSQDKCRYNGKKILKVSKKISYITTSPILITKSVYEGFKKACPQSNYLNNLSHKTYSRYSSFGSEIYGGVLISPEINKINI